MLLNAQSLQTNLILTIGNKKFRFPICHEEHRRDSNSSWQFVSHGTHWSFFFFQATGDMLSRSKCVSNFLSPRARHLRSIYSFSEMQRACMSVGIWSAWRDAMSFKKFTVYIIGLLDCNRGFARRRWMRINIHQTSPV